VELVHAALTGPDARVAEEAADLIFHVAAVLHGRGLSLADALRVLQARAH
jgi:phosphoribosyl-ATP pyrophosphohydrolase